MQITTPLADELAHYLDLSALELKVTAQNMANVDTPGYRTVGFNFAAAMQQSVESLEERRIDRERTIAATHGLNGDGSQGAFAAMDAASYAEPLLPASDAVALHRVGGLLERPDGNDVSVDREGMNMAKAQLQFNMGMELLRQEYTRVMDAIHVDK
ncbi:MULTISPECIES: flagellar biosynthesis protein FlgB [Acidobacterium]|uniref:Flagellar basal body rod protein FlgB n=1 Tax=Acidobacterium capsulatum (strain ATCC 51196 / DSM 11244 / BCRC 80197 / JCM 7670 / NBRC 15755 / NCIMB 13165 / 161) TaxID=240015 RepID=C1F981_ACIC5|nr:MULTISPECIES: flagellar biosynthesis protein FlgB [Acidobacterium]ACO33161.1 putative flagellar basal-body rod protein FlgB [Acidobacterium capsulatum ATCC 51196]HCT61604.1 flagellar biosynthesis protein FlgB [Acidobacterium sp.]